MENSEQACIVSATKRKTGKRRPPARGGKAREIGGLLTRVVVWSVVAAAFVAAVVGLVYALWLALFAANSHFTLRSIEANATGQMRESEIIELAREFGAEPDAANLFELDVQELRECFEAQIAVDRATVTRRLPDTLIITVYEREPMAQFLRRGRQLLDAEGWFLPPRRNLRSLNLPIVTGVRDAKQLAERPKATDEMLLAALRFLRLLAVRPDGKHYDVSTIQLDYSHPSLTVHLRAKGTFRKGARVVVPVKDMDAALDRMAVIVQERTKARQKTGFIDATYKVNVPVRP